MFKCPLWLWKVSENSHYDVIRGYLRNRLITKDLLQAGGVEVKSLAPTRFIKVLLSCFTGSVGLSRFCYYNTDIWLKCNGFLMTGFVRAKECTFSELFWLI